MSAEKFQHKHLVRVYQYGLYQRQKRLLTKSTITNVSGILTFFRPREMLKILPLQFAIDFKAVQRYERSYFSGGKLRPNSLRTHTYFRLLCHNKSRKYVCVRRLPAKRPMIFQPFWTTSIHRVDPYRDEFSTERFVGRYRNISTRTKLEELPRNLCPLINERRLLLTIKSYKSTRQIIKSKHPSELAVKDDLSNTSVTL